MFTAHGIGVLAPTGETTLAKTLPQPSVEAAVCSYLYAFGHLPEEVLDDDGRTAWRGKYRGSETPLRGE